MSLKYQIESIKPNGYYFNSKYLFENYLEKLDYYWHKYECIKFDKKSKTNSTIFITNKKIDFKIKIDLGEKKGISFVADEFKETIYQDYQYITISLGLSYFFKNLKPNQIFEIMAILQKELPFVSFGYYELGEKYGYEDSTIVQYENKIIKYFNIISKDKQYSIFEYFNNYKISKSQTEINSIVKEYLDDLNLEIEIYNDKLIEIQEDYEKNITNEKYTIEDSYYDGGGGDEWSDPSDFW